MSAKVENHVTDIATGITVTATVQVGDIGANKLRENRAEESASSRLRQLERRGLGNADEGGVLCQTHCPGSRGLCRRDSAALRMDVRGIKAAELFKLRDKKSLAVTLGP